MGDAIVCILLVGIAIYVLFGALYDHYYGEGE